MTKTRTIFYWATTVILAMGLLSGGLAQLVRRPETIEGLTHLGYPVYMSAILGFWKVCGAVTLLVPGLPRLKEWAYAGIFFNMTGAVVSHAVSGDATFHLIAPMFFVVLDIASWALRPQSRVVGTVVSSHSFSTFTNTGVVEAL